MDRPEECSASYWKVIDVKELKQLVKKPNWLQYAFGNFKQSDSPITSLTRGNATIKFRSPVPAILME